MDLDIMLTKAEPNQVVFLTQKDLEILSCRDILFVKWLFLMNSMT